jgi:hypothetical protein
MMNVGTRILSLGSEASGSPLLRARPRGGARPSCVGGRPPGLTVTLVRRGTTAAVRATVRYDASRRRVVLDPRYALAGRASYTARVRSSARDVAGNALSPARSWSFTTRR